jgi:hypothetical protein
MDFPGGPLAWPHVSFLRENCTTNLDSEDASEPEVAAGALRPWIPIAPLLLCFAPLPILLAHGRCRRTCQCRGGVHQAGISLWGCAAAARRVTGEGGGHAEEWVEPLAVCEGSRCLEARNHN